MIRRYAQQAHKRYTAALEDSRKVLAERPGDFHADRFTSLYAAGVLYDIYNGSLALDAVGNSALSDSQIIERTRAERRTALRWLLMTRPGGDTMHAVTQKIREDEMRRFLSDTVFVDDEPEPLKGRELLDSLRAADRYKVVPLDADEDAIARESRTMSASQIVHLFSVAMDGGRAVGGTRERIVCPDSDGGTMAVRVDTEEEVTA